MEIRKTSQCSAEGILRTIVLTLAALCAMPGAAQTAQSVLDKAAAIVADPAGVQAQFIIRGEYYNTKGTIAVKGKKFHATTPDAIVWYDGKTQWTYMKKSEEVNIAAPNEAQQAVINPYRFIYLYKEGYTSKLSRKGQNYVVHLKAKDKKKSIQEMFLVISQKTYIPSQVSMRQKSGWSTIDLQDFKKASLSDRLFQFSAKDFPNAEVIDLR